MTAGTALEDRFEVLKDIGDGSFGSVVLARVRAAGSSVARRGTVIAIKTMKKNFESFAACLELREVVFLSTLPPHPHLVPALDIFLDPFSKKLHIAMEYMDGNLYQLMKARDHKCLDLSSVKSILFQIMQGLEHIHANHFFHRDIKPENILVSTSGQQETGSSFRRYSSLMTPPSTPPTYTVKIADFGLARETHSKLSYTTYVSTRWYRAPEVLLRAGEYSSPVDIWAMGAMAVEIATLKPLFPGGNEVDQVWRVCEIMGSPGNWHNESGARIGGGEWKEGTRLASKLGFSFPKMAPHAMDSIIQTPQWPASLSKLVTWCLMWDPKSRPSSTQALMHEFFTDATDPLRPKPTTPKILGRKHSDIGHRSSKDLSESLHMAASKSSWFRKSFIGRSEPNHEHGPVQGKDILPLRDSPSHAPQVMVAKTRMPQNKRSTWNHGPSNGAPILILPTIRPISPLSDTVTAQANARNALNPDDHGGKKIGRQLSIASVNNHYTEMHRQEAEMALNGTTGLVSPPNGQKESFFSHLRKRARRFSGRQSQIPITPKSMDIEPHAGCGPWASNRSSVVMDTNQASSPIHKFDTNEALDRALRNVQQSLESPPGGAAHFPSNGPSVHTTCIPKRHHSLPQHARSTDNLRSMGRMRRSQLPAGTCQYETPEEEDELRAAEITQEDKESKATGHAQISTDPRRTHVSPSNLGLASPCLTPLPLHPIPSGLDRSQCSPPLSEADGNEWASSAAASIFAVSRCF
ncbi:Cyclin-dependent kinase F-4 [Blumeria hordei DH14]|uniref:Cyclin-dependent kinase F-4 n=1 Tax=Blumeria graminis f. sp. hordei (strain DH14) TaxID=546991 RepID=N1JQV6_BLUG1|nr:Cyclin-dependent kinase F-4 [Blumeria hordei DH14]